MVIEPVVRLRRATVSLSQYQRGRSISTLGGEVKRDAARDHVDQAGIEIDRYIRVEDITAVTGHDLGAADDALPRTLSAHNKSDVATAKERRAQGRLRRSA